MYSEEALQILSDSGVEVVDRGSGPVVALAHGAGGGVRENFTPLIEGIAGRRFIGPYWPGSGGTPRAETPLRLEDLADAVVASAVATGAERFPVVGLSLGSAVAVAAAQRHPEHVSGLVLTVGLTRADFRVRAAAGAFRTLALVGAEEALAAYVLSVAASEATLRALTAVELEETLGGVREAMPAGAPEQMALVGEVDVTGLLPGIEVPALVVVGGGDRLVPPDIQRELGAVPGARVIEYDGAGHIFTPDEAVRWTADVEDFLATV